MGEQPTGFVQAWQDVVIFGICLYTFVFSISSGSGHTFFKSHACTKPCSLAVILNNLSMKQVSIYFFVFTLTFYSCDNGVDKSLISDAEKLTSPNGQFTLYRYFIESSMSFGSGFSVIKILDSKEKCDYTDRDFLRFGNDAPFFIKWKNNDTLIVKCIIDGRGLSDKQPIKREVKKWKDWTFEVEYYSIFSASAEIIYPFDSYSIADKVITFTSKKDTLTFKSDEVQISLDTKNIFLTQFKIDTFKSKLGLAFSHYDFQNNYNQNEFLKQQSFVKIKL